MSEVPRRPPRPSRPRSCYKDAVDDATAVDGRDVASSSDSESQQCVSVEDTRTESHTTVDSVTLDEATVRVNNNYYLFIMKSFVH